MNKKIILITIGILLIGLVTAQTLTSSLRDEIKAKIDKTFKTNSNPQIEKRWNIAYESYENGITTKITPISETTLQLDITNINKGGYKFHSVICPISDINSIEKQIKDNSRKYTSIGNANYDELTKYGISETWCKETNNEGFILFSSGSKDESFKLVFPEGNKHIKIYTGSNSEVVDAQYGEVVYINGVRMVKFTDDSIGRKNNDEITMADNN